MENKIIYLTEKEFFNAQKNDFSPYKYIKNSKIKHKNFKDVYYYNEHQFYTDLKQGLISKTIFSESYLQQMKVHLDLYNNKLTASLPRAVGFFTTINNESIILRSDTSILQNYNNKINKNKAILIYFNKNFDQIIVLKDHVNLEKKFKKVKELLPANGIRIFKASFLKNKILEPSIKKIFGIGSSKSKQLLRQKGLSYTYRIKSDDLTIMKSIEKDLRQEKTVGLTLKRTIWDHLAVLFKSPTYRGTRHRNNLPVRGQRTRTNAKTRKRNRKKEPVIIKRSNKRNVKKK